MAQTTTNYGLLKPESTDSYNHLIYDNPNMDTIDAVMKANANAAIDTATCIKSGTTHTITRTNTSAAVFKFTATGDWITGDTMIVDGVTVTPFLVSGEALKTGAYVINTEVLVALQGTRATVYSNTTDASTVAFDDTSLPFTASNVQNAIEELDSYIGTYIDAYAYDSMHPVIATTETFSVTNDVAALITSGKFIAEAVLCTDTSNSSSGRTSCLFVFRNQTGVILNRLNPTAAMFRCVLSGNTITFTAYGGITFYLSGLRLYPL